VDVNRSLFVLFVVGGEAIDEGDVLYAHAGRSLSLYFSSLTTAMHLFFLSFSIYSRSSSAHTYTRLVDNDGRRRDFPPSFSSYVKRKTRVETKEKRREAER
jgi:hypothetical protein